MASFMARIAAQDPITKQLIYGVGAYAGVSFLYSIGHNIGKKKEAPVAAAAPAPVAPVAPVGASEDVLGAIKELNSKLAKLESIEKSLAEVQAAIKNIGTKR